MGDVYKLNAEKVSSLPLLYNGVMTFSWHSCCHIIIISTSGGVIFLDPCAASGLPVPILPGDFTWGHGLQPINIHHVWRLICMIQNPLNPNTHLCEGYQENCLFQNCHTRGGLFGYALISTPLFCVWSVKHTVMDKLMFLTLSPVLFKLLPLSMPLRTVYLTNC